VILGLMLATALFAAPSKKTVEVGDNYFAPGTTTVAKGGRHVQVAVRRGRG
jgi:hypothetical protein